MKTTDTSANPANGIVIHGAPGCGKTRNAAALARHYDKSVVLDDWLPMAGHPVPAEALALTNVDPAPAGAISFCEAMRAAGLTRP